MIGGNVTAQIQEKTVVRNEIGEKVPTWTTTITQVGFLDYMSGDSKYSIYNAKIQESTHLFICDYNSSIANISPESTRMLVNGKEYDILLIDNPMELNEHIEVYLKFVGGQ